MRFGEVRRESTCLLQTFQSAVHAIGALLEQRPAGQIELKGIGVHGPLARSACWRNCGRRSPFANELLLERGGNGLRELLLHGEDVGELANVLRAPDMP